jgi:FkbM family methyltransferase
MMKAAMPLRQRLKHFVWEHGWDVRRVTPENGLDVLLWRLLPGLGVNCVIDVGAHTGEFGMLVRALGYAGRIVSFEPTHAALLDLGRRARQDPDWQVQGVALGSTTRTAEIRVAGDSRFSSFRTSTVLGRSIFEGELATAEIEHVQVRRLDEMFGSIVRGIDNPRAYLKLDTQGWDLEVLSGAAGCLDRIVAAQSEMSLRPIYEDMPTQAEAIEAFRAVGFDVVGVFPLHPSQVDGLLNEFDCVMVRQRPPTAHRAPASLDDRGASRRLRG